MNLSGDGFIGYRFLNGFLERMTRLGRSCGASHRLRIKPGFVGKAAPGQTTLEVTAEISRETHLGLILGSAAALVAPPLFAIGFPPRMVI